MIIDICFLNNVDKKYSDDANNIKFEYNSINPSNILLLNEHESNNLNTLLNNINKEIKNLKEQIRVDLNTVIDSDIFEIEPKEKYTSADLNWNDKNSRSSIEMNDKSSRPEIKNKIDVSNYDTIIIGFPVWWYTAPTIINTFIEENNINSKDMYVFVTSGGSGVNDSFNNLKNAYPENNWKKGIRLRGNESESILKEWLDE